MLALQASAQSRWGKLTGSLQSEGLWAQAGKLYSNNYLKLDYVNGRFSAGLQAEYYPMPLPGYSQELKGVGLPGKYVAWQDKYWSLTAGDFYEQLGTGILFRSWEDRTLGWNNSIGGGRFTYHTPKELFSMKVLGGYRRRGLWYGNEVMGAAQAAFQWHSIRLEGSALLEKDPAAPFTWGWNALAAYEHGGFSARAEWVGRAKGNAQTLELGYAAKKFSSTVTVRRLQQMQDPMELNYLPSLCMEQSYVLATLNPYTTFASGELGGTADFYYRLKSWKLHLNGSYIFALPSALKKHEVLRMTYRDLNVQVEKKWTRRFKMVAFMSIQELSPSHGERKGTQAQNVFVLDGVYRFTGRLSVRSWFQYLYSQELTRDWMAAMIELSSTRGWSVHIQDMYNHGSTREHYYEAGVTWTKGAFKADLCYGHQRAGLVCSGGVCRYQPEYTGGLLRLNYQF